MRQKLLTFFAAILCAANVWADVAVNGKLPGAFSVSATKVVYFSQGNLHATTTDLGTNWTWSFAENQYDYIGNATANNAINGNGSVSTNGTVDMFAWSTANTYYGIHNDGAWATYHGDFVDWGTNVITNGGNEANAWRTMTKEEWDYLLNGRENAAQKRAIGQINMGKYAPYLGLFILPDEFEMPSELEMDMDAQEWDINAYGADTLLRLEQAGAVFLPVGGFRTGLNIHDIEIHGTQRAYNGYYWTSSTVNDQYDAEMIYISKNGPEFQVRPRSNGMLVRLVKDADSEQGIEDLKMTDDNKTRKFFMNGQLFIEKNGKLYNALGTEIK